MAETQTGPMVADIFRRAQAIRKENAQASYKDIAKQLIREYSAAPFPPTYNPRSKKVSANGCPKSW